MSQKHRPSQTPPPPITDPDEVAAIADEIAEHGLMAFDIEFVSADRLIPELALIQVGWGQPESPRVAAIDCLAVDATPLLELVASPDVTAVLHSARQDLGLLAVRHGITAQSMWDSQIAAAFAGIGDQIGYGRMIEQLLGVTLDKGAQFTDWLKRPLSAKQLRYALDDVRYLVPAWFELRRRLVELGRLDWVREESQRLADSVGPLPDSAEAYREVKGWRGLRGRALGSLQALAAWRQDQAVASNKPLSWIVPDRSMIELCRAGAATERAIRSVRGIGDGIARRHGQAIIEAIAAGAANKPPPAEVETKPRRSARAQVWAAILANLVAARSTAAGIAPRFVATRAEAEILAAWFDRNPDGDPDRDGLDIDLLKGWRRQLAGDAALAWLRGEIAIRMDSGPAGLDFIDTIWRESDDRDDGDHGW
ncbi:MAG: HRDC domain-containing protein [Myxococcota bacterium]